MCGIVAILGHGGLPDARERVVRQAQALRHRGPDWSGTYSDARFAIAHERLAIVDPESGEQPLKSPDGRFVLAVNGEIYNHADLREGLDYAFATESDCEVILPLHIAGAPYLDRLRGMFAFVLVDTATGAWTIARDPMGVIPLYTGRDAAGRLWVASEMKALMGVCTSVRTFPPGHVQTQDDPEPVRWWNRAWFDVDGVPDAPADPDALREALIDSVRCHLMSDVPYGVLLSGGLDSSVISAIAAKLAETRVEGGGRAWWPRLHSFSIGLAGSPDLAAAEVVADAIGTVHHGFTYTVREGLDALSEAIRHLETYDVTTIRAGTPMFLMARKIKAMGIKMVLSGEGSDEIFGGYLYFHKAPSARDFHEETVRKLHQLHLYDCNRANKAMAAWGVEARVPFLDTRFLDHAMTIPARHKMVGARGIEKELLRRAFDGWLPESVLWRQKEQFSDGVGYGWIDGLKATAETRVTDRQLAEAADRFPVGTPVTKEGYMYREIFEMHFPLPSAATTVPNQASVACSTAVALEWDEAFKRMADPSGRAVLGIHDDAYGE
ncbi:MAG: asparagine synthase B [Alphaproteobacteria bacterium]|nr:asparagine synthase B [Alphaproteobacteria bacterium]